MNATTLETKEADKSTPVTIASLQRDYVWLALVAATLVIISWGFTRSFQKWWEVWWMTDSLYSHGILVPFISAFIVYSDRQRLAKLEIRPNLPLGVAALSLVMLLNLACRTAWVPSIENFTFPIMLLSGVLLLLGTQMAIALLFPILFLLFMVPLPGFLLSKLNVQIQLWSTAVATKLLQLMQLDAEHIGTQINMPSIMVTVGAPCSGFRMLISLFAFSSFFAFMKEGPKWGRVGIVLFAFPLALLANSTRVMLIALVGEFHGEDAMHSFHDWSGYIMLVVSFVSIELVSRLLRCRKFRLMQ